MLKGKAVSKNLEPSKANTAGDLRAMDKTESADGAKSAHDAKISQAVDQENNAEQKLNLNSKRAETRLITGYFYADGFDYLHFVTSTELAHYKFIFKDGEIYVDDGGELMLGSASELIAAIKKIIIAHREKTMRHREQLENYEKIYTKRKGYEEFMKRHAVLKYELRKFQNRISHLHEALMECANEQNALKKSLKRHIAEIAASKAVIAEHIARLDDIHAHIQGLKNDKINRNIYVLTMISALLLPLNFITSFFGMNTNGLFLSEYQNATLIISCVMVAVFSVLAISLWLYGRAR